MNGERWSCIKEHSLTPPSEVPVTSINNRNVRAGEAVVVVALQMTSPFGRHPLKPFTSALRQP